MIETLSEEEGKGEFEQLRYDNYKAKEVQSDLKAYRTKMGPPYGLKVEEMNIKISKKN